MSGEHKSIQMVREHVVLRQLAGGDFETTADFEFRNHGRSVKVTMGFPERGFGDTGSQESQMRKFRSWVDGHTVPVRLVTAEYSTGSLLNLYVKRVYFGKGQTRHVRVHYLSESGGGYSDGTGSLMYDFAGGNWWGKVRESVLDVILLPGHHRVASLAELRHANQGATIEQKKNVYHFRWRNWQAQTDFEFPLNSEFPNSLYGRDYPYGPSIKKAAPVVLIVSGRPPRWRGGLWMSNRPHGFVCDRHLWVQVRWMSQNVLIAPNEYIRYDARKQRVLFHLRSRWVIISAKGAKTNSKHWPPRPNLPALNGWGMLYLPAKSIEQALHVRFTYNIKKQQLDFHK